MLYICRTWNRPSKSHNAWDKYPTGHHFVMESAHFCYEMVLCDTWDWCIVWFVRFVSLLVTTIIICQQTTWHLSVPVNHQAEHWFKFEQTKFIVQFPNGNNDWLQPCVDHMLSQLCLLMRTWGTWMKFQRGDFQVNFGNWHWELPSDECH